jgi:cell division transport system permease protein
VVKPDHGWDETTSPEVEEISPPAPARPASLVPPSSIAGRALVVIIAIMTFLGALTIGAVDLVRSSAEDWTASVVREVTIQIRPVAGRPIEGDVGRARDIALRAPGVASADPYTAVETVRMLEPWLGAGLSVDDLPIPRLIVVKLADEQRADLAALRRNLTEAMPNASLDDHRQWFDRLKTMARTVVIAGSVLVSLMLIATAFSVVFATRAAVATNRPVVEVLHFVGARDATVASEFMRHFLWLGLKGALMGGLVALACFFGAGFIASSLRATAGGDQLEALFGSFSLGPTAYVGVAILVILVAGITAFTSRTTVMRTLRTIE